MENKAIACNDETENKSTTNTLQNIHLICTVEQQKYATRDVKIKWTLEQTILLKVQFSHNIIVTLITVDINNECFHLVETTLHKITNA